jgi:hypothetical protein
MHTEIVTIADLTVGDSGTIIGGKFDGRDFRVRSIGTQGRLVMVDWTAQGTKGSILTTTTIAKSIG